MRQHGAMGERDVREQESVVFAKEWACPDRLYRQNPNISTKHARSVMQKYPERAVKLKTGSAQGGARRTKRKRSKNNTWCADTAMYTDPAGKQNPSSNRTFKHSSTECIMVVKVFVRRLRDNLPPALSAGHILKEWRSCERMNDVREGSRCTALLR